MARVALSDTKEWEFVHSDQDLRGRDLWDSHGHQLGTIDDMIIDTDTQRVAAVTLTNGKEFAAGDLSIAEDAVYVLNYDASLDAPPLVRRQHDEAAQRGEVADAAAPRHAEDDRTERPSDTGRSDRRTYGDLTDDFRDHYDRAFGHHGRDFSDWEPAYRFGYDMAFEPEFAGRSFDDAEDDLRRGYYRRMGYPMSDPHVWADVRDAVRHAFEQSRPT